ncbi:MAG: serpin family protein [Acidimicrobiales bacterium]
MAKIPMIIVVAVLIASACGSSSGSGDGAALTPVQATETSRSPIDPDAPTAQLAAGFNDAGFAVLGDQPLEDNTVISPVSISHALLMARGAADEPTGAAIDTALALPAGMPAHDAWNAIDQMIAAADGSATGIDEEPSPAIRIADRIWPAAGVTPDQDWVDLLATHHGSDVATIDVGQPEVSRNEVNSWVSDATEGLIPELLPKGFITGDTTLVLTDAIYFKAQWQTVFGKYSPVPGDFVGLDGTPVAVEFMRELENRGARGVGDGWVAAELAYLGDDFSMLLIVPDEGNFETIRTRLGQELLGEIDATIQPGPFELLMPKWEDASNIDLLPWLTEIGAAPGSYPGITPGSFLSGGVHAADVAVDEIGTVAAAATGLGFVESGPPEPEIVIAADKPFFYVIRHNDSGMALFAGQVTNPTR